MGGDSDADAAQPPVRGEMAVPIVQFSAPIMFADEGEVSKVEVMRIGALGETCVVRYLPADDALEGKKFYPCRGELEFGPGEHTKTFDLRLMEEKMFDSVVEIPFKLEAVRNCEVGLYLGRTLIKIIDDDVFPSGRFREETLDDPTCDKWRHGKDWSMMWEIIKLCYSINSWGAKKILIGDQINNAIFVFQLYIGKELINALANDDDDLHSEAGVMLLAILLTVPYAFTHLFSYSKQFWKVGGMVRKEMLKDLMVRILYYKESTRDVVHSTEVRETFSHHVFTVVSDGYMQVFPIVASLGRIVMILFYFLGMATANLVSDEGSGEPDQFYFIIFFAVIPLAACVYVRIRITQGNNVREASEDAKIELINYMDAVIDNYRVVADCWARPLVMSKCSDMINTVNKWLVARGARQANDLAFFGWANELVEGFVIILGGFLVLRGGMTLGAFTASMAGLRGATGQYAVLYKTALKMQSAFPAQWMLCQYMNLPMDLDDRDDVATKQRKLWTEQLMLAQDDERVRRGEQFAEDVMPIKLVDVKFEFPVDMGHKLLSKGSTTDKLSCSSVSVLNKISVSIEQGQLIGVTGPPGHGKGTLLRVLAEVLLPSSGTVFVPSHLRVMHVEVQDNLYPGSVAFNVYFGLMARRGVDDVGDLDQEELDRGVAICKSLNMMDETVEAVRNYSTHTGEELKGLSKTTRFRIQLARALIANPEVLVLHLPVESLNEDNASAAMEALHEFVRKKGVQMPMDPKEYIRRRPRTCIFTSNDRAILTRWSDKIYSVVKGELFEDIHTSTFYEDKLVGVCPTHHSGPLADTAERQSPSIQEVQVTNMNTGPNVSGPEMPGSIPT